VKYLINLLIGIIVYFFVIFSSMTFASLIGAGANGELYIVASIAILCAIIIVSSRNIIHAIKDANNSRKTEDQGNQGDDSKALKKSRN